MEEENGKNAVGKNLSSVEVEDATVSSSFREGGGYLNFPIKERFIWLSDDVWLDLDWAENEPQEFMDAVMEKNVFDDPTVPPPFHGDVIAGRDKYRKIIVFKLLLLGSKGRYGQEENDWA